MYVNDDGHVVIDDHFVCEFMKNASTEFMVSCESVIKQMCLACSQKTTRSDVDDFMSRLIPWGKKIIESVSTQKVDLSDVTRGLTDFKGELRNEIHNLKEKIDVSKVIDTSLKRNDEGIMNGIGTLQKTCDVIHTYVHQTATVRNTTRYKGEEGESGIIHILECKLPLRDGYEILETKSKPHNCDALVKRIGFPDVRIEVKAHGRDTGECVRGEQVKRFETDLIGLNNHGIFVSLYSGIVGKAPFELDLLPTNKFAVYISNNNYDGDAIKEFINLIYKLDGFVSGEEGVKISTEAMTRIKAHMIDFNTKITQLKTNMKASLDIINGFTFDIIEKLLSSGLDMKPVINSVAKFTCVKCTKDFSRASSLANHVKVCGQKD
jgi:ferritin-like metal-binding protein YciE